MHSGPLLRLACAMLLGIVCALLWWGQRMVVPRAVEVLYAALCVVAASLIASFLRRASRRYAERIFGLLAVLFFFLLGATLCTLRFLHVESMAQVDGVLRGIVSDLPRMSRTGKTWGVKLQLADRRVVAYLHDSADAAAVRIAEGNTLLFVPQSWNSTTPRLNRDSEFRSFSDYLFFHGVAATCYVPSQQWRCLPASSPDESLWGRMRREAHLRYVNTGFAHDELALVEALTLGNKRQLSPSLRQDYSAAGVSHVLALSGMHLTILLFFFNFLIDHFLLWRWRLGLRLLLIPLVWAFVLFVGMPPSLVRAAIMCTALQLSLLVGTQYDVLDACVLAAFLMLLFDPFLLLDIGFQLSFLSMLAIAVVALPLMRWVQRQWGLHGMMTEFVVGTIVFSVVCTAFTSPIVAMQFGRIPLLSVVSNLVVSLAMWILMGCVALYWLCWWWPQGSGLLAVCIAKTAGGMNSFVHAVGSVPCSTVAYCPDGVEVLLLYGVLGSVVAFAYRRSSRRLMLIFGSLIAFCVGRLLSAG